MDFFLCSIGWPPNLGKGSQGQGFKRSKKM